MWDAWLALAYLVLEDVCFSSTAFINSLSAPEGIPSSLTDFDISMLIYYMKT